MQINRIVYEDNPNGKNFKNFLERVKLRINLIGKENLVTIQEDNSSRYFSITIWYWSET